MLRRFAVLLAVVGCLAFAVAGCGSSKSSSTSSGSAAAGSPTTTTVSHPNPLDIVRAPDLRGDEAVVR
jgi:hypothetical protein